MSLIVATCLWKANDKSQSFSRGYDEEWVEKLYRGFRRNLTVAFEFVVFVDLFRRFSEPAIRQTNLTTENPDYGCFIEPYRLDLPMILVGLDTIIVRNIDHMAEYCLTGEKVALPRDPYKPERSINGVALVPAGQRYIFDQWRGENDMEWLRKFPWQPIDDLWPGEVLSLKFHDVRRKGLQDARIVYFHGNPKPNEMLANDWVRENWR
jgi:hypothetical protein